MPTPTDILSPHQVISFLINANGYIRVKNEDFLRYTHIKHYLALYGTKSIKYTVFSITKTASMNIILSKASLICPKFNKQIVFHKKGCFSIGNNYSKGSYPIKRTPKIW